jgi:hypothetical protein
MSERRGEGDEPRGLAAAEPGFVDLFPELVDGADLGVMEYFPPAPAEAVDLTADVAPGAA